MDEQYESERYDDCLDGLLGFLKALPTESVKLLNVPRYTQMLTAAARLRQLLGISGESGEIEIEVHRAFNMGVVRAEIGSLTVLRPALFMETIKDADNFEVYPLTNGNLKVGIAFQAVLKTIG